MAKSLGYGDGWPAFKSQLCLGRVILSKLFNLSEPQFPYL